MQPEEDYSTALEQHELIKREGVKAWAEAIAGMLPNATEEQKILIKEGLSAMMSGPPSLPPLRLPEMPGRIDAEFVKPPDHIYEQVSYDGSVTVWDWVCLASRGTHARREPDRKVRIFKGDEEIITLTGDAALKFWEWKTAMLELQRKFGPGPALPMRSY